MLSPVTGFSSRPENAAQSAVSPDRSARQAFLSHLCALLVCCRVKLISPLRAAILLVITEPSCATSCRLTSCERVTVICPTPWPVITHWPIEGWFRTSATSENE